MILLIGSRHRTGNGSETWIDKRALSAIWLVASNWWERSPNASNSTNFTNVNTNGNAGNNNNASNTNALCPRFLRS